MTFDVYTFPSWLPIFKKLEWCYNKDQRLTDPLLDTKSGFSFCLITKWSTTLTVFTGSCCPAAALHLLGYFLLWLNCCGCFCSISQSGSNIHSLGTCISKWLMFLSLKFNPWRNGSWPVNHSRFLTLSTARVKTSRSPSRLMWKRVNDL